MKRLTMWMTTLILTMTCALQGAANAIDTSNLDNCIQDVHRAANSLPNVATFDDYMTNYVQLLNDLQAVLPNLPHVYQEIAAKPLIQFLENLGETEFLQIFQGEPQDEQTAALQQIIPDAALAILVHDETVDLGVNAFEEIVSDLYAGFLNEKARVGEETGRPVQAPTYGEIPPLVKFGNPDAGPYTWPGDATYQLLGMGCGLVSLPSSQLKGGLIAWSSLGHETGGHDVLHAYKGLLEELARKVYAAVLKKFKSIKLANYWAGCIDESASDTCGYLNMGPSLGLGLIGYFRALGDGKLRTIGFKNDPHPIDLLRGYLAAGVVKRLHFKGAAAWSKAIIAETKKDNAPLYLANDNGFLTPFPVSFDQAVASADLVAQVIMQSPLDTLHDHSLQGLQDWTDQDQSIVDSLVSVLNVDGRLPVNLQGPDFYAAYVVAAATQAALQHNADLPTLFNGMLNFLAVMHRDNPIWSKSPTAESIAFLEQKSKDIKKKGAKQTRPILIAKIPAGDQLQACLTPL